MFRQRVRHCVLAARSFPAMIGRRRATLAGRPPPVHDIGVNKRPISVRRRPSRPTCTGRRPVYCRYRSARRRCPRDRYPRPRAVNLRPLGGVPGPPRSPRRTKVQPGNGPSVPGVAVGGSRHGPAPAVSRRDDIAARSHRSSTGARYPINGFSAVA